jgi:hypothetical protein
MDAIVMSAARTTGLGVCTAQCRHIQIYVSRTSFMLHSFGASSLYSASTNTETVQISQTTCVTRRIHRRSMIPRYRYFQEVTRILWKEQNVYFWTVISVHDFFTKLIWELRVTTFMHFLLLSAHGSSPSFIDEAPKSFEYKTHFPNVVVCI